MIVGFTGTKKRMTKKQKMMIKKILIKFKDIIDEYHHGDCIGSDEEFHEIVSSLGFNFKINIHPPINPKYRAFCKGGIILPSKEYIERDDDIIDASTLMLATPKEFHEILHSGTWTTIRHSIKKGIPLAIIYPNGKIDLHFQRN